MLNWQMSSQIVEVVTEKSRPVFVHLPVHLAALYKRTPTLCVTSGPVWSGYECAGWIFHLLQQKRKKNIFFLFFSFSVLVCDFVSSFSTPPPPLPAQMDWAAFHSQSLFVSSRLIFPHFQNALYSAVTHETWAEEPVSKTHVSAMHSGLKSNWKYQSSLKYC